MFWRSTTRASARTTTHNALPYPFADKLDPHGIWWEDVLQTARRVDRPDGQHESQKLNLDVRRGCPQVVFAGNGTDLFSEMDVLRRPTRQALEEWLWPKLQTRVRFENDSPHTIRTWWVHGGHAKDPMDVAPGATLERNAYVSHLFAVRDVRAGGPLTKESCLNWQHVDSDANPFVIRAAPKCQDWHGDCGAWGCVEIKILRRVRAESSRRPPRHRRDACSMAWRCRSSPLDRARTAASSPRNDLVHPTHTG